MLEVHGEELAWMAQLVTVDTARLLAVERLARAPLPHRLRPTGQVEQARMIAQRIAARRLPTTLARQAYRPQAGQLLPATPVQAPLGRCPVAGTVIQVGQFVQHGGLQLQLQAGMPAARRLLWIGEQRGQQPGIQLDTRTPGIGAGKRLVRQRGRPAHADRSRQAQAKARRQARQAVLQQTLADRARLGMQATRLQLQLHRPGTLGRQASEQQQDTQ